MIKSLKDLLDKFSRFTNSLVYDGGICKRLRFVKNIEKRSLLKYQISQTCYYDIRKRIVFDEGREYKLTSYEIKIIEYLFKRVNQVVTYDELLDILDSQNQKSLISLIYKINKKLPIKIIENIKDIGYKVKK
jgi:DNA-binding response OmpR family regulator